MPTKRYFINPIPDEGGALDDLPTVICLDETPGTSYYTYIRERITPADKDICQFCLEPLYHYGYYGERNEYSYCPNCGARVKED